MKCPTCHGEYDESTNHNCPLKSGTLGSWGGGGSAQPAVVSPAPTVKAPPPKPATPPPQVDLDFELPASSAAPQIDFELPASTAPPQPQIDFELPAQPHMQPEPLQVQEQSVPQMSVQLAIPPRRDGEREIDILEDTLDFRFHVEKQEDPNIGKIISERYRIVSLVGRGGMGMVYRGEQVNLDRPVAIKMLYPNTVADADAVKRFKQEAQAVAKVEHPHSVRVYEFGMSDTGQPYIVMDFIDGHSLRDLIKDEPLNITRAEDIFSQVIDALAHAHRFGVIHRDLKPENIMMSTRSNKQDWVSIVDFGISSFGGEENPMHTSTKKKEVKGSPPYMSPEQCSRSAVIDNRSDIYSLAVVLYEALSGKLPYNARTAFDWIEQHSTGKPIPLTQAAPTMSACEALEKLILKAMEKNPDRRYQTAEEFGNELKEAVRRDQIHLGYLKNRREELSGSSSRHVALTEEQIREAQERADANVISGKHNVEITSGEIPVPSDKYFFTKCPHCSEPCEPDVAFCLGCGRSLATTQDFAKVRAAQGVFTLPKGETLSSSVPAFSAVKVKTTDTGLQSKLRLANKALLIVSLLLAVCICFFLVVRSH